MTTLLAQFPARAARPWCSAPAADGRAGRRPRSPPGSCRAPRTSAACASRSPCPPCSCSSAASSSPPVGPPGATAPVRRRCRAAFTRRCGGCCWSAPSTSRPRRRARVRGRRRPRRGPDAGSGGHRASPCSTSAPRVARVVWGLVADRERGTRRSRRSSASASSAASRPCSSRSPCAAGRSRRALAAAVLLAFGVLGFNGIVYLVAGEVARPGSGRVGRRRDLDGRLRRRLDRRPGARAAGRAHRLHDAVPASPVVLAGAAVARGSRPVRAATGRACRRRPRARVYTSPVAASPERDSEVELVIDSLAFGGRGVARLDDFVIFVDRALPGDRVRARLTKVKRRYGEATTLSTLESGPGRVPPECPHFGACGGCRFQDLAYEAQLRHKAKQVRDALERIGHQRGFELDPIVPAARTTATATRSSCRSRRRTTGPRSASTAPAAGTRCCRSDLQARRRGRQRGAADRRGVGAPLAPRRLGPAHERRLLPPPRRARVGPDGRAPADARHEPGRAAGAGCARGRAARARARLRRPAPRGHGRRRRGHAGRSSRRSSSAATDYKEKLLGLRLRVSAGAFLQTNTEMCERLYELAIEEAGLGGDEVVWDLYSGIGSIALALAGRAGRVVGDRARARGRRARAARTRCATASRTSSSSSATSRRRSGRCARAGCPTRTWSSSTRRARA